MRKTKGITLIALIITIIIMLILVAVSISILINSGLIGKAKQAGEDTKTAYEQEQRIGESYNINGVVYNSIDEYIGTDLEEDMPEDIFVCLYNDHSLVFSNNEEDFDSSKISESYGNIKDDDYFDTNYTARGWCYNRQIEKVIILNKIYPTSTANWFMFLDITTIEGLNKIDTRNCTDMSGMFSGCPYLTTLDVSSFDTSKVTDMSAMFGSGSDEDYSGISQIIGLNNFNTQNVTNMTAMFGYCSQLVSVDLSSFDTHNVTHISHMFICCGSLEKIEVGSNWDMSHLRTDDWVYNRQVFYGCNLLKGGSGTTYDSSHTNYTYAHVDEGPSNPGYLTLKTH